MATVTGFTAQRMQVIEDATVVDADVVGDNLILEKKDGSTINAGSVRGPAGPQGPQGIAVNAIPGEVKLWPGSVLPDPTEYGNYAWANGAIYDIATYPEAAANIDPAWNTALGATNPGAGKFRVPDLRGLIPACLDALPIGSGRVNRVARPEAIQLGKNTGEEKHVSITSEMPKHTHVFAGAQLPAHGHAGSSFAGNPLPGHSHTVYENYNRVANATFTGSNNAMTGLTGSGAGTVSHTTGTDAPSAGTPSGSVSVAGASAGTPSGSNSTVGGITDTPDGQGVAHENMPPTIFVPYIVKLDD